MIRKELSRLGFGIGLCLAVPAWPADAPTDGDRRPAASTLEATYHNPGAHVITNCRAANELRPAPAVVGIPFRF